MLFEIPPQVYEQFPEHYYGVNLALWIIFTLELLLFGVYFTLRARKAELDSQKKIDMGFAAFGYFFAICRFFFIIMIHINGGADYDFYCSIAYFWGTLSVAALIYPLETVALNRKPILTILGGIATFLTLLGIIPGLREPMLILTMSASSIMMMILLVIYIFLIRNTSGVLKQNTIIGFFSIILFVIAIVIDGQFVLSNPAVPKFVKEYVSPILAIISILILVYSKRKVEL